MKLAAPLEKRSDPARRSLRRYRRVCIAAAMLAALLSPIPARSYALSPNAHSGWTAFTKLYISSHGRWKPATSVDSLGHLRGVLTVHGRGLTGNKVTATMALRHLSWQIFKKVIMPPTVTVTMKRISGSKSTATFVADVRIPTTLPVFWSVVQFVATNDHARAEVRSGVMVGAPAQRIPANTLTVSQAPAFCAARPRLPFLRYAVYLHGYYVELPTAGDGPAGGIILDRPRHVTSAVLHTRTYAHGISTFGFNLPKSGTWITAPGFLRCTNGKPDGFSTLV